MLIFSTHFLFVSMIFFKKAARCLITDMNDKSIVNELDGEAMSGQ